MNTMPFGALGAGIALSAVLLCALTVALALPTAAGIVILVAALLLIASAGGLIGAAVAAQRKSGV